VKDLGIKIPKGYESVYKTFLVCVVILNLVFFWISPRDWWHTDSQISIALSSAENLTFIGSNSTYMPHINLVYVVLIVVIFSPSLLLKTSLDVSQFKDKLEEYYRMNVSPINALETFDEVGIMINSMFFLVSITLLYQEGRRVLSGKAVYLVLPPLVLSPIFYRHLSIPTIESANFLAFCLFGLASSRLLRYKLESRELSKKETYILVLFFICPSLVKIGNLPVSLLGLSFLLYASWRFRRLKYLIRAITLTLVILFLPFFRDLGKGMDYVKTTLRFVQSSNDSTALKENLDLLTRNLSTLVVLLVFAACLLNLAHIRVFTRLGGVILPFSLLSAATLTYLQMFPKYLIPLVALSFFYMIWVLEFLFNLKKTFRQNLDFIMTFMLILNLLLSISLINDWKSFVKSRDFDTRKVLTELVSKNVLGEIRFVSPGARAALTRGSFPVKFSESFTRYSDISLESYSKYAQLYNDSYVILLDDQSFNFRQVVEFTNIHRELDRDVYLYVISPYTKSYDSRVFQDSRDKFSIIRDWELEYKSKISAGNVLDSVRTGFGFRFWIISEKPLEVSAPGLWRIDSSSFDSNEFTG